MNSQNVSVIQEIVNKITVSKVESDTLFNGVESPYEAIIDVEPSLQSLPFAKRLTLTLFVWNKLLQLPVNQFPKTLIYSFFKDGHRFEVVVVEEETGEIVFAHSGMELIEYDIMSDEFDLNGLGNYLEEINAKTSEDTLIFRDYR